MKLSESLLHDKEIGQRIFTNSVEKAKNLLSEVFALEFKKDEPSIINITEDPITYSFKVVFNLNSRELTAVFSFEKDKEDILSEVVRIHEFETEFLAITESKDEFKDRVMKIQDILENKYDINFTPLDPEEKDDNIVDVISNYQEQIWEAVFTSDYHEAEFKATYKYEPDVAEPRVKVFKHKQHIIYLD